MSDIKNELENLALHGDIEAFIANLSLLFDEKSQADELLLAEL